MAEVKALSKNSIRTAGDKLRENTQTRDDLNIISTFRANHVPIMTTLVNTISKKLPKPLFIARRLKRLSSIRGKLRRAGNQTKLDRMQDIAGVRAVFKDNKDVFEFLENIKKVYTSKKCVLKIKDKEFDYINEPKPDGYRSYHLVFEYQGGIEEIAGYKVELQLRTLLHHYWATAVEILALKSSTNIKAGYGDEHFKRFFWLCGEILNNEPKNEYVKEIKELDAQHNILALLAGLNVVADKLKDDKRDTVYLISLDYNSRRLKIIPFSQSGLNQAKDMYQALETDENKESVLVSVDSINKLRKAYPNYFLDAKNFIKEVEDRIK